jgi:hypothetical protein
MKQGGDAYWESSSSRLSATAKHLFSNLDHLKMQQRC